MSKTIGNVMPTLIASLSDAANIEEAFRLYHYGATGKESETNPLNISSNSIARRIYDLQQSVSGFVSGVLPSAWTGKGVLITASAASTPVALLPGTNDYVLTANSSASTGLEWKVPVNPTNAITLTNKTLSDSSTYFADETDTTKKMQFQLSGVTTSTTRTLTVPDVNGTIITSGNLSSITSIGTLSSLVVSGSGSFSSIAVSGNAVSHIAFNQQSASYTLVLTDDGKIVEISNASANTLTIPLNSSVAFPVGTQIIIVQTNTGQTTIAGASGVTVNGSPGLKLRGQWSSATIVKRATDTWLAMGDLVA